MSRSFEPDEAARVACHNCGLRSWRNRRIAHLELCPRCGRRLHVVPQERTTALAPQGWTWPELVAMELQRQEDRIRNRK
jgi:DNA-directed RNA polymerase subunit RPC12/RpoP